MNIVRRLWLCVVMFLITKDTTNGWLRHDTSKFVLKRNFPVKKYNKTLENSYRKSKLDFFEAYKRSTGENYCYNLASFVGLVKSSYMEFYKKRCLNSAMPMLLEPPPAEKQRPRRYSRRSRRKNIISPKKKKKIDQLLKKSKCRRLKTMVPIQSPDPEEELYPCEILVYRCAGCCYSRLEKCVPTKTRTRKFDVLRSSRSTNETTYTARTLEHVKCECKCKVQAIDCEPNQTYDEKNCACKCPKSSFKKCSHDKKWSDTECQCGCKEKKECSTGEHQDPHTCKCRRTNSYFMFEDY